jgi:hypothetical protein
VAIDPELKALFAQTIWVAPSTGTAGSGDPTYGAAVMVSARVEKRRKVVVNAAGDEVNSDTLIFTDLSPSALTTIEEHDRVWLPGENPADPTLARLPLKIDKHPDEDGTLHHFEVSV